MSLAARLKSETQDLHDWIEQRLDLGDPLSLPRYRRLLERWLGFYEPFEAQPADERIAQWIRPAWRTRWLREDLIALGASDSDLAGLARCPRAVQDDGLPQMLGMLYVLEGSALGGRVIARRARDAFGSDLDAFRFFDGHGAQTSTRWQRFKAQLEADIPPVFHEQATRSAREAFALLGQWLAPDASVCVVPATVIS